MAGSCFVVIGDTSVARRVCSSLTQRGHDVRHAVRPDDAELSQALDGARADGIAILLQDDVVALRYALAVAHIQPAVPMVVTIFDRAIGDQLARFLPHCVVTSPADLAAPSLAGPCVQPGLLALTPAGDRPRGVRSVGAVLDEVPVEIRTRPRWRAALAALAGLLGSHDTGTRILLIGLLGILAVLLGDWVWLMLGEGHGVAEAFHDAVRVVTTVGPAADAHGNSVYAFLASFAMLSTIVFTAMFTAGVVDRLLGPRLTALLGARALPRSGHVIVVGLGQVGLRLCRELRALGIPVVGVERDIDARNLRLLRESKIPAVIGHGGDRALLERIGIHRAIALAAVSSDDRDNVAVSLAAQAIAPRLRLVLRAGEQEVLAETGSLLPLGVTRDVTSLSATYALARLLGLDPRGVIAGETHVHLRRADGEFEEMPISSRSACRHTHAARTAAGTPTPVAQPIPE
ncbi:MAG TPA: NAD(P)-binding protein [Aldersonia sp.]